MDALLHGLNEFINLLWRGRFLQLSVISKRVMKDRVAVHKIRERCGIQNEETSIFLHACESWTLTAELQRRIQALEMGCYRKIPCISYKDYVTNEESVPRSSRQSDHTKTSRPS